MTHSCEHGREKRCGPSGIFGDLFWFCQLLVAGISEGRSDVILMISRCLLHVTAGKRPSRRVIRGNMGQDFVEDR